MAKTVVQTQDKTFHISYELFNYEAKKSIVFLHGWGSNKEVMKQAFQKYLGEYKHIYLDMPGFGKSPTDEVLKTDDYKQIVQCFLCDSIGVSSQESIIVGHSFGGKVATLLAPKKLVLLSSAGIVEPKSLQTRLKIALAKLLKVSKLQKISHALRSDDVKSMSENMYKTFKNVVDEDFSQEFEACQSDSLVCWGKDDKATSFGSGKKIAKLLPHATFVAYEGDHYFFLRHAQDIAKRIADG